MPNDDDWWSFVVLPDTQIYTRAYPHLFSAQTEWIRARKDHRRIQFVLHAGDITDGNAPEQWKVARGAFDLIEGRVPYLLATGNHDYGPGGSSSDRTTAMLEWFPIEAQRAPGLELFDPGRFDNAARVFETPSGPFLAYALEFGPRPEVIAWARGVSAKYRGVPAALATHAYLYDDATRYDAATRPDQKWAVSCYGISKQGAMDAEALWKEWISTYSELEVVVSGHVLGRGVARLSSERADGSVVHQLLANYQHTHLGGAAYLRVIDVYRDRFEVHTYSPHLKKQMRDPDNDMVLPRGRR